MNQPMSKKINNTQDHRPMKPTVMKLLLVGTTIVVAAACLRAADVSLGPQAGQPQGKRDIGGALSRVNGEDMVKHRFFRAGWQSGGPAIFDQNFKKEWSLAGDEVYSDGWVLPDGGIVFSYSTRGKGAGIIRLSPDKKELWKYVAPDKHDNHTCQPLPGGGFLAGETAKDGMWIVELSKDGKETKRTKVGNSTKDMFHTFREVRKTPEGTYLAVIHNENKTCEWDANGKLIRTFLKGSYVAMRLPNGNTLISALSSVVEYDPTGKVAWEATKSDIESLGIKTGMLCGIQRLPNGNTVIANVERGSKSGSSDLVRAFEITRDKKLVWSVPASTDPGSMGVIQILDVPGDAYQFGVLR